MKCWVDMYLFNSAVGEWACAVSNVAWLADNGLVSMQKEEIVE
jgi:hypothetical protein